MNNTDPQPAARRPRDIRWRALAVTGALVVLGGLLLEFSGNIPNVADKLKMTMHVEQQKRAEIDQRFQQGVVMLHAKQYEHALTAFHRVLALSPKMPEAHANIGFALLGMKEYRAARDFFESATALRPGQLNAYFGLAEALAGLGDNFGAMQAMDTYAHLAPKDDPFRRKAEAAAWELRSKLEKEMAQSNAEAPAGKGQTEIPAAGGKS